MTDNDEQGMLLVEAVEALKSSWSTGESSIGSIGNQLKGETRLPSLLQLVLVDSELALKAGKECNVEQYLSLFSELQPQRSRIEQHIREVHLRFEHSGQQSSPGMFSKASLDQTIDHASMDDPKSSLESGDQSTESAEDGLPDFIGGYRILKVLGEGSFGKVLLAQDLRLNRNVAIKIQDPKKGDFGLSDAFLHEARAISRLEHPNIVRLLHVDETAEGLGYLVYEYVPGDTLADRVKVGDYSVDEVIGWIASIARALDFAHRRGVVHRDISPRNIMIDSEGCAKLLDFGLSRLDDRFPVDDENRLLGTPHFMSPEQASGKPHWATSYADIFSLGSVLYYALCGKLPFPGNSVFDICERVQSSTPPPLRSLRGDIPSDLETVVLKAMAKEPQARYSTGADFATALEQAVVKSAISKPVPTNKRSIFAPLIACGMILIGAGFLWQAWKNYELAWKKHESDIPKSHIDTVRLDVERGGRSFNLLSADLDNDENKLLPIQADDDFRLAWKSNSTKSGAVTTIVIYNDHDLEPFVITPPTEFRLLEHEELFPGTNFIILCLAKQELTKESMSRLPSPFEGDAEPDLMQVVYTSEQAPVFDDIKYLKRRSGSTKTDAGRQRFNLSEEFKKRAKEIGIEAFFGVVLARGEG